ncbi:hypothetical protein CXB51_006611 [Gossypium anomalum]|uniref:Uncharacterized protein n=1 Tax=Gossypium anomalum TaxID=47600 RepID=A0A8J5ZF45_9ROSI|nr:hypothetical protein CXB51_006611 [Gossypium anomalum]
MGAGGEGGSTAKLGGDFNVVRIEVNELSVRAWRRDRRSSESFLIEQDSPVLLVIKSSDWGSRPARADCGGVLRDKKGVARALSSSAVDAIEAVVAETNAVKAMRPWSLKAIFTSIDSVMLKAGKLVLSVAD